MDVSKIIGLYSFPYLTDFHLEMNTLGSKWPISHVQREAGRNSGGSGGSQFFLLVSQKQSLHSQSELEGRTE